MRNIIAMLLGIDLISLPLFVFGCGALNLTGTIHRASTDEFNDPGLREQFLYLVPQGLATRLAALPMLFLAYRLVDAAIKSDPFTPQMVRRIRTLGLIVVIGGAAAEVAEYVRARILVDLYVQARSTDFVDPDVHITLWWAIPGLAILAMSEVVRRGVWMRTELDAVI